jgi:hypothetical protein
MASWNWPASDNSRVAGWRPGWLDSVHELNRGRTPVHIRPHAGYELTMRSTRRISQRWLRAFLLRSATLWIGTRIVFSLVLLRAGVNPLRLSFASNVESILLTVVVAFVASRRQNEQVFLGNLGLSPSFLTAVYAIPAIAGETLLSLGSRYWT